MKITWLGHSAFRIETGKSVIILDPFLSGSPVFNGDVASATAGATHVALTHGHEDHVGDAVDICAASGATLIAVYEVCAGLGIENFEPGNTGGTIYTDDFDITFVRADHSSSFEGKYMGNPCGFVITCKHEDHTVYHMGDTDIFGDMALINEIYAPDVGIIPIGDRFTMRPQTAALACQKFFDFKTIIPCHYKTFPIIEQTADGFIKALGDLAGRVQTPDIGGSITI